MEQPIKYWVPSIAPSGMAFYTGDLFPAWKGNLFVGALAGQMLVRLELDGEKVTGEERLLAGLARAHPRRAQGPRRRALARSPTIRPGESSSRAGEVTLTRDAAFHRIGERFIGDAPVRSLRQSLSQLRLELLVASQARACRSPGPAGPTGTLLESQKSSKLEYVRRMRITRVSIDCKSGLFPNRPHVILPRGCIAGRVSIGGTHVRRIAAVNRLQRQTATRDVPHISRDHAARPHDPRHLARRPSAGSGTKLITSAMIAASKLLSANGRSCAPARRNCASFAPGRVRA